MKLPTYRNSEFCGSNRDVLYRAWKAIQMTTNVDFMRTLEEEYRQVSGLENRSKYKIFYGQVFPAPVLTLGLNPGGTPEGTSQDGTRQKDGSPASSSGSYFEQMENDVLDCNWKENSGLRKLLLPLVGQDYNRVRSEIVKTNVAFRRSGAVSDIDLTVAAKEAVPFLEKIMARVSPRLIVLTGPNIDQFLMLYAQDSRPLTETIKAPGINHVVFAAAAARLRCLEHESILVQVAHASQFSWTYERYSISTKMAGLMGSATEQDGSSIIGAQSTFASTSSASPRNALGHKAPEARVTSTTHRGRGRLAELESKWRTLRIDHQFRKVHHFSSDKFSSQPASLEVFIAWCDSRDIKDENAQTLERGLDVARRVEGGQAFKEALREAWAEYPIVTR